MTNSTGGISKIRMAIGRWEERNEVLVQYRPSCEVAAGQVIGMPGVSQPCPSSLTISATFQKLQTLFEDIFEESDNFSAEPTLEELMAAQYFSSIRKDGGQPLLSNSTVEKITRYVSRLRGGKKVEGLEWDREILGKGLRLMERSMLAAEGLVIFKDDRTSAGDGGQGSKKAKGKKGKNTAEGSAGGDGAPVEVDNDALSKMEQELAILSNAGQAAACTFIVLDSPGIHKQVWYRSGLH